MSVDVRVICFDGNINPYRGVEFAMKEVKLKHETSSFYVYIHQYE